MDVTAADTARLTGIALRSVNTMVIKLHQRIAVLVYDLKASPWTDLLRGSKKNNWRVAPDILMSDTDSLFEQLLARQRRKVSPPLSDWQPGRTGKIDIRIAHDGTWYHNGRPIQRHNMVRLFASVLRRDLDGFYLLTPVEKLLIEVEDAPFMALDMEVEGSGESAKILFVTNVEDHVLVDAQHPLRIDEVNDEPRPYVQVRDGLDALITRPVYYRLVALAREEGRELVVYSCGERFSLGYF